MFGQIMPFSGISLKIIFVLTINPDDWRSWIMENYTLKEKIDNDLIFIIKHITIPFYFISTVMLFLNIQPCHTILHLKVPVIWDIIRNCKYHKNLMWITDIYLWDN